MIPHRISIKTFVKEPEAVDLSAFVPVFHRWIQEHSVEELLIDVIDYKHVHQGPGIMLIGHEADYALDVSRARPGLVYTRKRQHEGNLQEVLRIALRQALKGCQRLESDPTLKGRIAFHTGEIEIAFLDRLHMPNHPASLALVRDDLETVLAALYGDLEVRMEPVHEDPRQVLTVCVQVPEAAELALLVHRLNNPTPIVG